MDRLLFGTRAGVLPFSISGIRQLSGNCPGLWHHGIGQATLFWQRSFLAPPPEVIGALACHYESPYTPTPWDIERNESFAKLIGVALMELRGAAPQEVPIDDTSMEQPLAS